MSQGACLGSGWVAGGTVLAGWGVGANLGRLEPAAELKRFGRKCRIAWDDFCAVVKLPAITSTAGTDRPVGEIGELPGRIVKLADEGPGGAPAGTTDPGKCRWAPPAETTPGPTRPLFLTGRRKVRHEGGRDNRSSSSPSNAASDTLSSRISSSLPPNETMLFAAAEGRQSAWEKTGSASLGGKSEEREGWSCSLKRKLPANAERKDSYPYSGDIPSR